MMLCLPFLLFRTKTDFQILFRNVTFIVDSATMAACRTLIFIYIQLDLGSPTWFPQVPGTLHPSTHTHEDHVQSLQTCSKVMAIFIKLLIQ